MANKKFQLGVIGAGNMAEALVRGILDAGVLAPETVVACDPHEKRRAVFAELGLATCDDNQTAARAEVVLLSVKPQVFDRVVGEAGAVMDAGTLVVSIAAGIRTNRIAGLLPTGVRIVRVMPNTPLLVGRGAAGIAAGSNASAADVARVEKLLGAAGKTFVVEEADLDALTAVSGSGPAYVFRFVELLAAAGEAAGLTRELATELARETIIGAGRMLEKSASSAGTLREQVTSPGGTTAAALAAFQDGDWRKLVTEAVLVAKQRSIELAAESDSPATEGCVQK